MRVRMRNGTFRMAWECVRVCSCRLSRRQVASGQGRSDLVCVHGHWNPSSLTVIHSVTVVAWGMKGCRECEHLRVCVEDHARQASVAGMLLLRPAVGSWGDG